MNTLSSDLLEWADIVFVMEEAHRTELTRRFKNVLTNQRVICLDIPDQYNYMDPGLVQLLET